jgi:glycosyltransferase involved in cell wall biosynthesis
MSTKFKIAMIAACPLPYPRGTPIRIYNMAKALADQGCVVHLITYHLQDKSLERNGSELLKIHRIPDIFTYKKFSAGPSYQKLLLVDFFLLIKILKVLNTYNVDIIHAHHYEGLIISLLAKMWRKHPVIYDAHTLLESELHCYDIVLPNKVKKSIGRLFDSKLPKRADHIIAVTKDIKDKLILLGNVKPQSISVVINGVEIQHFKDKEQIDITGDPVKKLIYTGNLGKHQGIEHLLNILANIITIRKDIRLIIATNDSFKNYRALANKLGVSSFIDIVDSNFDKLPSLIHSSHIMLNPRVECDGIPQKLLNYMASGKPIVSFEGSAKILNHNQTGHVVKNNNYKAFAEAVVKLLDNYQIAKKLGNAAKKLVDQNFTWESKSKEIINIYKKVQKTHIQNLSDYKITKHTKK